MVEFFNYEKPKPVNKLQDVGMSALSGLGKTASGILSLPEELPNLLLLGGNFLGKKAGLLGEDSQAPRVDIPLIPSFSQAEEMRMKDPILSYEPQTKPGEFAQTIAEFGGGGRLFGKIPGRIGAGAGAVKEGTEGVLGEGGSTALALGLDLGLNVIFSARNPAHISALNQSINNLKKQGKLQEAEKLMNDAKELGVNLSAPEAIAQVSGDKTALNTLDIVSKTDGGMAVVNKFTKDRFSQLSGANLKYLNENFGDFDISKIDTKAFTNKFVDTLVSEQKKIKEAINLKARTLKNGGWAKFDAGSDLSDSASTYLSGLKQSIKNESVANRTHYQNIANRLVSGSDKPITNTQLQDAYQFAIKEGKNLDLDPSVQLIYKNQASNIKQILDSNEYFARASEFTTRANAKLSGRLDTLSLGQKDLSTTNPTFKLLESVLFDPKNVDPINIIRLSKELNKIDKNLFPELAGLVMNKRVNNVMKAKETDKIGGQLFELYMGKGQKPLTLQLIKQNAISQNKDPDKAVEGFEAMMKVFQASDNLPGAGSQTATRQAGQKDLENLGILDIDPGNLGAIQKLKNWVSNSRSEELANMFFSDNAINQMIDIANNKKKGFATTFDFINDLTRETSSSIQSDTDTKQNKQIEMIDLKEYK